MDSDLFTELKIKSQEIIDLIAQKRVLEAEVKLSEITNYLNDLIDFSTSEGSLKVLSRYQILLKHFQIKIATLKFSLN